MGLSQPYLAILSAIAFITVITSLIYVYIYIVDQVNRTPVLGVYSEAIIRGNELIVTVTVKHTRGGPVELSRVELYGEKKLIVLFENNACYALNEPLVTCRLTGTKGTILPGSTCRIEIVLPAVNEYFAENKMYQGVVFFNEGTYPVAFTPVKLVAYTPPEPVLPVFFTDPLHHVTFVNLNRTARRAISYINYTDFDMNKTGWRNFTYPETMAPPVNVTVNVTEGYSGYGTLLSETSVKDAIGVYLLDLDLRINTTVLASYRFKWVNGTGSFGIIYILTSMGQEPPHSADRGVAVVVDVTRAIGSNITVKLNVMYFDKLDPFLYWYIIASSVEVNISVDKWYFLFANYTLTDRALLIHAYLTSEDPRVILLSVSGTASILPGLPRRFIGIVFNETSVVVDDVLVMWGPVLPVTVGGLPVGEYYTVALYDPRGVEVARASTSLGSVNLSIAPFGLSAGSRIVVYYPSGLRSLVYNSTGAVLPGDVFNATYSYLNATFGRLRGSASVSAAVSNRSIVYTGFTPVGVVNHDNTTHNLTLRISVETFETSNLHGNISLVSYDPATKTHVILGTIEVNQTPSPGFISTVLEVNMVVYLYFTVYIDGAESIVKGIVHSCALENGKETYCILLPLIITLRSSS
ncbi:MAG: hypothetical protein QXO48_04250 [Desulfurococcaceae archaeon]